MGLQACCTTTHLCSAKTLLITFWFRSRLLLTSVTAGNIMNKVTTMSENSDRVPAFWDIAQVDPLKYIDVSEMRIASTLPWWWRMYAHLKRRSISTRLHSATSSHSRGSENMKSHKSYSNRNFLYWGEVRAYDTQQS